MFLWHKQRVLSIVLLLALSSVIVFSVAGASDFESAYSKILAAEDSIGEAYGVTLETERVGANVTDLLVWLNYAAGSLSGARMAFREADFETAASFAELSNAVASQVYDEAAKLEIEANVANANRLLVSSVVSVLGVSIVLTLSYLIYGRLKRRYNRQLLKMRPKVGEA